jgi:hypothetical protein
VLEIRPSADDANWVLSRLEDDTDNEPLALFAV